MANPPIPRRGAKPPPGTDTPGTTDTRAPRRESRAAADAPPPPSGTPPTAKPRATGGGSRAPLQKSLEELFSAPAYVYALNGDEWAEAHVNEHAPKLAEAWYKLAQKNPAVKRTLEKLTTGSAWGGVAVATGVTVLPLLSHHGVSLGPVDAFFAGVPKVGGSSGPIVPPPPGRPPGPGGGGTPKPPSQPPQPTRPIVPPVGGGMTPPQAPGQPAGVVTVAASNNRAVMVDG